MSGFPRLISNMLWQLVALLLAGSVYAQALIPGQESEPVYFDSVSSSGELSGQLSTIPTEAVCSLDAQAAVSGNVTVVRNNGASSNRVDIVFLGDGYTQGDISSYSTSVSQIMSGMFAQAPLSEYANYFNVHRVDVLSNESGVDNDPGNGTARDTALDSQFWCQGTASTLCTNVARAWEYAGLSRDADQLVVLVNSTTSGAAAYPFSDLAVLSARQSLASDSMLHQFGHSMANLADEYDNGSWPTYTGFEPAEPNVSALNATAMSQQGIKWHRWLGFDSGPQYGGLIGTYEGAMGHLSAIYRATADSKMRSLNAPFNAPSVEAFIGQIYRLVNPIDDSTPPSSSLTGSSTLFVTPLQPVGRNLDVQWFVNGQPVPGATGVTFRANNYPLADGIYTVSVTVTDNTSFMRDEVFRAQYMTASRSWTVAVDQNPPLIISQPQNRTAFPGQSATFSVTAQGEDLHYQWLKNGQAVAGATGSSYTTPAAARGDSGAIFQVVVSNVGGSVTSSGATLTIGNRAPSLAALSAQQLARGQSRNIALGASDPDGDSLIINAVIEVQQVNPGAQISVQNGTLQLTAGPTYLGSFNVTVTVSDQIEFVSRTFAVSVINQTPAIVAIPQQNMKWRTDSITVAMQATDADGETVSFAAALNPPGSAPVVLSVSGNQLTINPEAGYMGTFNVKATVSDGSTSSSTTFAVNVYDTSPVISTIANQTMHWKTNSINVPISASDADGDPLFYSAVLAPGETAQIALSLSGSTLTIDPPANFLGSFNVRVDVNDTKRSVSQIFRVDVYDGTPVLQGIANQSMYWRTDSITVPLVANDPDNDPLTFSAALASGNAPVNFTISGNSLVINPAENYLGTFSVRATVSDGQMSASRTFSVNVFNSAPTLQAIPDQTMHRKVPFISVPVSATDADGEQLSLSATLAPGETAPVDISMSGTNVLIDPANDYLGSFRVRVRATDGTTNTDRTFSVLVYNTAPMLAPIPDQLMHWIKDDTRTLNISAQDADGETLTLTAEVMGNVVPEPELNLSGNALTIDPADRFLGSFIVRVTASDGALSDVRSFTVTSGNAAPDLQPICDRSVSWSQLPYNITLLASDPDEEELTYNAAVEEARVAYDLDQTYNFSHDHVGWDYNLLGLQEKYLQGTRNAQTSWYMILPNGELYEYRGSRLASVLIATLPDAYYQDPLMLVDVPAPTGQLPPVVVETTENVLSVSAPADYRGTVLIRVRASDGYLFDEENFLLTVYDGAIRLNPIADVQIHWTEDRRVVSFTARDLDGDPASNAVSYSANFADTSLAYNLDQLYGFGEISPRSAYAADFSRGRSEKYVLGGSNLSVLFSILPNGDLYRCNGNRSSANIDNSVLVGHLPPAYYRDPSLLFNAPPSIEPPIALSVESNSLTIDHEAGFVGKVLIAVTATQGEDADSQIFVANIYNDAPVVDRNPAGSSTNVEMSWNADRLTVPFSISDQDTPDQQNLSLNARIGQTSWDIYDLDQAYSFVLDGNDAHYNELGWREKHIIGVVNGDPVDFVILPSGALYLWETTVGDSTLFAKLPQQYYLNPQTLVDVVQPSGSRPPQTVAVSIQNDVVTVVPQPGHTGDFHVLVEGTDENRHVTYDLSVQLVNHAPVLDALPNISMHWRTDKSTFTVNAAELDNEPLRLIVLPNFPGAATPNLPVALSLDNAVVTVDPLMGYTGQFTGYVIATTEEQGIPTSFGQFSDYRPFNVHVYNNAPSLNAIGGKQSSYKQTVSIALGASDADATDRAQLSFSAWLGNYHHRAYSLSQQYQFAADPAGWNLNARGFGEKYFRGTKNGASANFVILPNGEIFEWNGSFPATNRIGHLSRSYYDNPAQLFGTPSPGTLPTLALSLSGTTLSVTPSDNYTGTVPVTVEVSDGNLYSSETFDLTFNNSAPTLAALANVRRHFKQGAFTLTLSGNDSDGDALSYSASILNAPSPLPAQLSRNGNQLTIIPSENFLGDFTVQVAVSDGATSASRNLTVTIYDTAPTIQVISNQTRGWKESFSTTINASDTDNDGVTLTAIAIDGASSVNVSLTGRTLTVAPKTSYVGTARIQITASDGRLSTQSTFTITYSNRAPTLSSIPTQSIRWNERTKQLRLVGSDPDGDPLSYSAVSSNTQAGTVAVSGSTLTITLVSTVSFAITATVSDGPNRTSQSFNVTVTNGAPTLSNITSQTAKWTTDKITVPFSVSDPDGETPTVSARLAPGSSHPATFSISGSTLTINLTERRVGSFNVELRASDALVTVVKTFSVALTNTAPTIVPIADRIIPAGTRSIDVAMSGSDADGDALSYTASWMSEASFAYDLDRIYDFKLLAADYEYNKLGNREKYFGGTKYQPNMTFRFVIYPTGQLYEWTGQLSTSKYLTTLSTQYYTDPSKLFNVAPPSAVNAPAQLRMTGNLLTISPNTGYSGRFWIMAAVTDTKASANTSFMVNVLAASGEGDDSDSDGCVTKTTIYSGDYQPSGITLLSAEGRIGDVTGGPANRTHELRISQSSSGSFAAAETAQYSWRSGTKVNFSLNSDPDHNIIKFTVGSTVTSHELSETGFSDIFIRATSLFDSTSVSISGLKLNGEPISDTVGASLSLGKANVLGIRSGMLNEEFTLEGSATMTFGANALQLPKDSELGFQISLNAIEGHATQCNGDDDGERKVTICHIPPGNHENAHTIKIGRSALPAHLAHGDVIGECPGNPADPGDGGGTCEQKKIIASPNYTLWNSFLGMIDILELTNPSDQDLPVKISFYSITGALANQLTVVVPAVNQRDVILNEFPGFVADSYGVVKLEFSGPLDGRMMYYRPSADGAGYDFAFDIPLSDANFGTTAVSFNTYQPSMKPEERNNLVANWLSIVNLDSAAQRYSVNTYDTNGALLLARKIEVAPFGRADIDGGHDLAGPNVVGVHVIIPDSVTAEYIAQLTRFGGDAPAGFTPSKYKFAFPLSAKLGQSDPIYAPISNKFNEYNWIEVVNILDKSVGATINFYGSDGRILESLDATLPAHAQLHFNAGTYLQNGETGYAAVVPRESYSLIAQSMGYLREPVFDGVTAVYGSQARRALPCLQSGSYNLYLNMQDWLLVANTTDNTVSASIQLTGPSLMSEKTLSLAPRASVYLPIHDVAQFGAQPDTYGLIAVKPTDPSLRLFAEVMRVRYRANGAPDFAAPTPVR